MPDSEVPQAAILALALYLLIGGLLATALMVVVLRVTWKELVLVRGTHSQPIQILAQSQWNDGLSRLVLVLTTTSVGALFALGLLFGDIHLQGLGGFILAAIFTIQGGVPLFQQIYAVITQQKLADAIRQVDSE